MKVLLFDFDGVLADTFSFCYRIMHERDSIGIDEYRARFEGNVNETTKRPISLVQGTEVPKKFDFFARYTPELMKCVPNPEIVHMIKDLAREYTLVIVSSTVSPSIDEYLKACGLRECFAEILGNDVEKSKVKKIQMVLQKYALQSSDTLLVTDTLGDIKEASACDVASIAVTWGYHPAETLMKGEPYRIVHRPKELMEAIHAFPSE